MASKDLVCLPEDDTFQQEWKNAKPVSQDEFVLTKVVGLTNISKNALDCNPVTGYVAFPASCMLVLLDPKTNDQKFIKGPSGKSISCVSFSDDGRFVAVGDAGVKPLVSVWSLKDHKEHSKFVVEHCVGVKTIAFHPKFTYLVIIGVQDLNIGVWDYVRCQRLALTKWQTIPMALTIPKSGASVILCGHRKITLFNLDKVCSNSYETNVFEDKKAVLLGRQSEYTFVDITSGKGKYDRSVYTVTTCGYLCEIRLGDILIDKASKVDAHAYCVRFALSHIFIGCCEGVVKICNPDTLAVAVAVSLDQLLGADAFPQAVSKLHLETTALAVNEKDSIVTCIYANCSIYSWQINHFTDTIECSVLLPSADDHHDNAELESCISESVCRANMFRSLMGCLECSKYSRLFDTETLAARNGMRCHHDLVHVIKGNIAKSQHVTAFRFSPDGRDVICGNEAGEIKVYDASSGVLRRVIEAHSAQVMCIELLYDEDYQLVCTGGRDRIIFILNAKADFSLVQVLCDHSAAITAISLISHDGLLTLVSAAADNLILVRRATPGNSLKFTVTGQIVESRCNKALNVTGDYIITGDKNGNIKLFKADPIFNPKLSKTLKSFPKGNQITSVPKPMCIDPTGSFIATAQNPGQIVVYHLLTGQPMASLSAQSDASAIKFTSCLRYMISSTSNGCTMIWKIPERMTEFLVAKRNKSYQIEIAKEVSYETTYVSCVKICKEMTVGDSPKKMANIEYTGPNSNHNYDTDATPSIESLSFLHAAQNGRGESERNSLCSTDSYISCSTCRDSCSDTVHWCPSTDSSIQTNSRTDRFCFTHGDNICGRIIESSECRKLGPFRQLSDNVLNDSMEKDNLGKNIGNNSHIYESINDRIIDTIDCQGTVGCEAVTNLKGNNQVINKEPRDASAKIENVEHEGNFETISRTSTINLEAVDHASAEIKGSTATSTFELKTTNMKQAESTVLISESVSSRSGQNKIGSLKTALETVIFNNQVLRQKLAPDLESKCHMIVAERGMSLARKQLGMKPNSPRSLKKTSSPISFRSYKTACSPDPTKSMDTSCSPGNSIFYSPSPCFSSDLEDIIPRLRLSNARPGSGNMEKDKCSEHEYQPSDCAQTPSLSKIVDSLPTIASSSINNQFDPNLSSSLSGIISNLSIREHAFNDPFFLGSNHTLQPDKKQLQTSKDHKKDNARKITSKSGTVHGKYKATFVKNSEMGLGMSYGSGIENVEKSENIDLLRTSLQHVGIFDVQMTMEESASVQSKLEFQEKLSTFEKGLNKQEDAGDEEAYNYRSITRDESGKLRLVANSKNSLQSSPLSYQTAGKSSPGSSAEFSITKEHCESQKRFQESTVRNIQCSMCSRKEDSNQVSVLDSDLLNCNGRFQESAVSVQEAYLSQEETTKEIHRKACSSDAFREQARYNDATRRDYIRDMNEKKLEEYFSELRQCLQLTNSQETVYKLVCDAQDQELMELLELVLKKRPSAFMESLNLPPDEIEMIARNLVEPGDTLATNLNELTSDFASVKSQFPCKVIPHISKEMNEKMSLLPETKEKEIPESGECETRDIETVSCFPSSKIQENEECSQNTAKAIINLVGHILTSRRAAHEQRTKKGSSPSTTENNHTTLEKNLTDGRNNGRSKTPMPVTLQLKPENDCQPLLCQNFPQKPATQQYMMRCTRSNNRQMKPGSQLEVLNEGGEEKSDESDTMSDVSINRTRSTLSKGRYGQLCSSITLDSGIDCSMNEKLSYTGLPTNERADERSCDRGEGQTNWATISPEKTSRALPVFEKTSKALPVFEKLAKALPLELARQQSDGHKDSLRPDAANVPEDVKENLQKKDKLITSDRRYPPPIVELFRDQDEYLKKLKEVREKFEMSIQALSKERKSRLAEEERQQNK